MAFRFSENDDISSHTSSEEEEQLDTLIFPINVHESLKSSGGLKKGEKVAIIVSIWVFLCFLLAWFLASWLRPITSYYFLIVVLIELALQLTIGMYILRFALDERTVLSEVSKADLEFSNYFRIYREHLSVKEQRHPFDFIEFTDGSYGVYLQCRLGHNTQVQSNNTYEANKLVEELLANAGLNTKVFYHTEDFKSSKAADELRDTLSGIDNPQLFAVYREMLQNYLNIAEEQSNVLCVTRIIFFTTRIQKDDMNAIIEKVLSILESDVTAYRQVSILSYEEIVNFLQTYYALDIIDMGAIKTNRAVKKTSNISIQVLKLYGLSGKVYVSDDFRNLNRDILHNGGIESL